MQRYTLHWLCRQPTPYNDFLFRSLAADPEINLIVHFIKSLEPSHPWRSEMAQGFPSRTYQRRFGLDWHLLRLAIEDSSSFFVVAGWHEATVQSVISLLAMRRRAFALWTDTPSLSQRRFLLKAVLRSAWLRIVFQRATYVMGTGGPGRSALIQMGCPESKILNFPFFVDLDTFKPASKKEEQVDASGSKIQFVSSGRLCNTIKGHDIALKALAEAKRQTGLANFRYRIAGTGPDRKALETLSEELGLENAVEFIGWQESAALPEFYRSAQVLLHPSLLDPFPVTILEGMASGLAVLGSDVSGSVLDRVTHGHNGLIHRAGDATELAKHIGHILVQPKEMRKMGTTARRKAEEWPVQLGLEVIKDMLNSTCGTNGHITKPRPNHSYANS